MLLKIFGLATVELSPTRSATARKPITNKKSETSWLRMVGVPVPVEAVSQAGEE